MQIIKNELNFFTNYQLPIIFYENLIIGKYKL